MKSTIAIITNDILFSDLFVILLKRSIPELEILTCASYKEIDEKTKTSSCELILVDGGLTGISSIELIQYIRMTKHILAPVWFFPEIRTPMYIQKAKETGVNKLIYKPFDPYLIVDEITSILKK